MGNERKTTQKPTPNYAEVKHNFISELKNAAANKKSSLSFIKNALSQKPLIQTGIVQTIVIGGTNYISSISSVYGKREIKTLTSNKGKLPIFKNTASFSEFIEKHLDKESTAVALNFAFPLNPVIGRGNVLDGVLFRSVKEHAFDGLIGQTIGELVSDIYFINYNKRIPVTVANDTVCLTLAGDENEDGAMVLGTGFNMSLKIIEKGQKSIVNLEAGNFNGFEPSSILKIIDNKSEQPGKMLLEKAVAGKYLVYSFNEQAEFLDLKLPRMMTSEELSRLSRESSKSGELARSILKESASLIASALAGIYEFKNRPARLEFITEGSLFWKGYMYQENVQKQLAQLGVPENTITFKYVEDSSIKGAIGLLLS